MKKQILGSIFLLISSILYSSKYISTAIVGATSPIWSEDEYIRYLSYVPTPFNVAIFASLIIGIIYFAWALSDWLKEKGHVL